MTHSVAIMGWQRQKLSPATFSGICRSCRGGRHIDSVAYTMFTIRWPAERCQEEPSGPIDDYDGCSCAGWDSVWQHQHCRRCWVGSSSKSAGLEATALRLNQGSQENLRARRGRRARRARAASITRRDWRTRRTRTTRRTRRAWRTQRTKGTIKTRIARRARWARRTRSEFYAEPSYPTLPAINYSLQAPR